MNKNNNMNNINGEIVAGDVVKCFSRIPRSVQENKIIITVTETVLIERSENSHTRVLVGLTSRGVGSFLATEWVVTDHQKLNKDRRDRPTIHTQKSFKSLFPNYTIEADNQVMDALPLTRDQMNRVLESYNKVYGTNHELAEYQKKYSLDYSLDSFNKLDSDVFPEHFKKKFKF